jgi:transposase
MQTLLNIGVDVAKQEVVVACADDTFAVRAIVNARRELLAWLKALPQGSRIGLEATGGYHDLLADLAHGQGFTVFVLNPKDIHHYAKAMGSRAKTDRVDAQLIARYIAHEHTQLHPYHPPTIEQRRIDQLLKRRAKLSSVRAALRQSLKGLSGFGVELKAVLKKLNLLIDKIDASLLTLSSQCPKRAQTQQRLQSVAGIGPIVGISLTNLLHRVPFKNADALVAFVGYDTKVQDSGQKRGRRRLTKRGPADPRRLLYIAAMAAAKTKTWKPIYEHYRSKGFSTTAALCIIARKITRTAWSIFKYETIFDPKRLTSNA